jgi:hypothetical protein
MIAASTSLTRKVSAQKFRTYKYPMTTDREMAQLYAEQEKIIAILHSIGDHILAGRLERSGSGGCGAFTLAGEHIAFAQTAGTMMACLQGMDQEQTFLQALASASRTVGDEALDRAMMLSASPTANSWCGLGPGWAISPEVGYIMPKGIRRRSQRY